MPQNQPSILYFETLGEKKRKKITWVLWEIEKAHLFVDEQTEIAEGERFRI